RIDPRYDNVRPGARRITGYVARTELAVSVRDLTRIGAVLDAALRGGATEITQISYRLNDATEAREEAYRKAVAEIRSNAATIAEAAGGRLGSIISIGTSQIPVQQPRVALQMAAQAPTIQPGEISVSVNVNARFVFIEND
ncbi:MAG: SIMPL domain-containing protein, partial [Gemmatimonadetes bacterium]|nr:SIMPL domain-containing protein [Gemmatimonadota bacterium]